jgi:hypothetical protein
LRKTEADLVQFPQRDLARLKAKRFNITGSVSSKADEFEPSQVCFLMEGRGQVSWPSSTAAGIKRIEMSWPALPTIDDSDPANIHRWPLP